MNTPDPKFAPLPHWCALSGMSRTATYNALGRGDLTAIKVGSRTLIDVDAGLAWLRSLPAAQIRPPKQSPEMADRLAKGALSARPANCAGPGLAGNVQITLITKTGVRPILSKRIYLDGDGSVRGDGSQCLMTEGIATRVSAAAASELAGHVGVCGPNQAIALGALKPDIADSVTITIPSKMESSAGAITRSRDFIDYRQGNPGWALIDFDTKSMPTSVRVNIEAAGGSWNALLAVAPGLTRAARVSRPSTSAGLFRSDTGERIAGSGGAHHYVLVKDAGDIERFLKDLHDRCWLNGLGWHLIGGAGQLLDRSLVDRTVAYGERLCFEGAPLIEPPLAQDATKRVPNVFEGEAIDTSLVVPKLTEYERHRVNEAKAASAAALDKAAVEVRSKHDRALAEKISTKSGMPIVSALRLVAGRHRGVLLSYLELEFDHVGMAGLPVSGRSLTASSHRP